MGTAPSMIRKEDGEGNVTYIPSGPTESQRKSGKKPIVKTSTYKSQKDENSTGKADTKGKHSKGGKGLGRFTNR